MAEADDDDADEIAPEIAEAQGLLDGIVEEAVAAGQITVEEAADIEDAIEEAAVELTEESEAERPRSRSWRSRRTSLLRRDALAGENLRGLRSQGAAGGARALRLGGRTPAGRPHDSRPGRLHVPAARVLRARGGVARLQPGAAPDRRRRAGSRAPLHWHLMKADQLMADEPNKPNRPIRPRGGPSGRKRRVVIDGGNQRGRDGRQARDRSAATERPAAAAAHRRSDRPGHRPVGRQRQGSLGRARNHGRRRSSRS